MFNEAVLEWMGQQEQSMLNEPSQIVSCEPHGIEGINHPAVSNNSHGEAVCDELLLPD